MLKNIKWNKRKLYLSFMLFFSASILLYMYVYLLNRNLSVATGWGPAIDFGRQYIIENGYVFEGGADKGSVVANYINYGSEDVMPKIYFAMINIVVGRVGLVEGYGFYRYIPWISFIVLPSLFVCIYRLFANIWNVAEQPMNLLLIYMVSVFPLASAIGNYSAPNGTMLGRALFLMMLFIFVKIVYSKEKNTGLLALFIILNPIFYMFYHTWSYYYFFMMGGFLVFFLISKRFNESRLPFFSLATYFVVGLTYNRRLITRTVRWMFLPRSAVEIEVDMVGYTTFRTFYSYVQTFNVLLLLVGSIIFLYFWYREYFKNEFNKELSLDNFIPFIITGFLMAFALFTHGGFTSLLGRIFEGTLFLLLIFFIASLIQSVKHSKTNVKKILQVSLVLIVLCCTWSMVNRPGDIRGGITSSEYSSIEFLSEHQSEDAAIFSDFRLITPNIYHNKNYLYTFRGTDPYLYKNVSRMYYEKTTPSLLIDNIMEHDHYSVIISERQKEITVVTSGMVNFRPASENFVDNFDNDIRLHRMYDSGKGIVFYRDL